MWTRLLATLLFPPLLCTAATAKEIIPPEMRGRAMQPQVAAGPDRHIHVVFGAELEIFHTASAEGVAFSQPVKIGQLDRLALGRRRGPRIVANQGVLVATAISHADGDLHQWLSADHGLTWQEGEALNSVRGSAKEGLHAMASDGKGKVATVWLDARAGGMAVRGRFSSNGGRDWSADTVIYQSPDGHICECCVPNVAIGRDGEITVMWRNWLGGARDLYQVTSHDGGETFAPAAKLGSGTWKLAACPMDGGGLTLVKKDDWVAVWRREGDVFASTPEIAEMKLASGAAQPLAIFTERNLHLFWEQQGSLMMQTNLQPPQRWKDHASALSIASRSDLNAVAVWESGSGDQRTIEMELFNSPIRSRLPERLSAVLGAAAR